MYHDAGVDLIDLRFYVFPDLKAYLLLILKKILSYYLIVYHLSSFSF